MIKNAIYTYGGANQDITKSKHLPQFYFEAQHIKILSTDSQSTGSVSNEKGNELIATIPSISINTQSNTITYGDDVLSYSGTNEINSLISSGLLSSNSTNQQIIGHTNTRNGVVIFTTDNSMDCIWYLKNVLNGDYNLELLYLRPLGFSTENPIQAIFNFENDIIQKVYWVDGKNQIRFINIKHSIENGDLEELIDLNSTNINITGEYSLSQPQVPQITQGGSHTSGMIQYAYNLYKLNSAQTTISPISELVPLDFGGSSGGGEVNENVGSSPLVEINDLDERYTHIKLYAIKYTSYNQEPQVSLIVDEEIANHSLFSYFDDGSVITNLSTPEFLFLGSNVFTANHIESKDNRLFAFNITDNFYDIEFDARAYSHDSNGVAKVWDNVVVNNNVPNGNITTLNSSYSLPLKHDAINPDYNTYRYQSDGVTLGGEGKFIKFEIVQKTLNELENPNLKYNQFFKEEEIYRLGIQVYNSKGQISQPFWTCDYKMPRGNLIGNYNTLKVEFKPEFYTYINSLNLSEEDKPVGYKVIRADRTINDKTIICQGNLTGMMVQTTKDSSNSNYWIDGDPLNYSLRREEESLEEVRQPMIVNRGFQENGEPTTHSGAILKYTHLRMLNHDSYNPIALYGDGNNLEIFRSDKSSFRLQNSWQYNKMFQMYSPDILFNKITSFNSNLELKVRGLFERDVTVQKKRKISTSSGNIEDEIETNELDSGFPRGFFGPISDSGDNRSDFRAQRYYYNAYSNFTYADNFPYVIYRSPEVTERGQGVTSYNGDSQFKYNNSLINLLSDRFHFTNGQPEKHEDALTGANCEGVRCATIVLGPENYDIQNRRALDDLYRNIGVNKSDSLLIAELAYPDYYPYTGNIYGGNTYEDKTRSSYIEIGEYKDLTETSIQIDSPGDTFVQTFQFGRLLKSDVEDVSTTVQQLSEIMSYTVESSINLLNRNDLSLFEWDNKFQPRYDEYHNYNRVYSQQPTLIQNQAQSFKFKKNKSFDVRGIASKLKIPGEIIDNWTDFLENEIIDLDGKYGPINGTGVFNDNIYVFQDKGIASLSINPRVQVQAQDGIDIELGTGSVLYDYNYLTTKSGSINKWSVIPTKKGIYYYDALNKAVGRIPDFSNVLLSDAKGFHSFFNNNFDYSHISEDNPILKKGVLFGYDNYNNDVYFTLHQKDKSFTWCFNELKDEFIDLKTYKPSQYINLGERLILPNNNINELYESYKGEYNKFFGQYQPSYITLMINPESNKDCVFNNILYKSELYLDDIDQPDKTLTHIQAWNEYQNTGRIELKLSRNLNLRRKFREWKANIPRDKRDRIRNPWIFLKLELDTEDNYKMILHDVTVFYSTY